MRFMRRCAFLLAFFCGAASSVQATRLAEVGDLPQHTRPPGVPESYVVTPVGYVHPSCVVQIHEDEEDLGAGVIRRADGSERTIPACMHPRYGGSRMATPTTGHAKFAEFGGWAAYGYSNYTLTPPAKALEANWTVPAPPTKHSSTVVFLFPGLEAAPDILNILQPVLAWNQAVDQKWTLQNWNCCSGGIVSNGDSIDVNPGDRLHATMIGTRCEPDGACAQWTIRSTDLTTGESTTFRTAGLGQALNWYFSGVIELAGLESCDELPADGRVEFTRVHVADLASDPVPPEWLSIVAEDAPDCDFAVRTMNTRTSITFRTH